MPYGFFKFAPGARQQDGFFVDENNRILFWPTPEGPGFELDQETATKIAIDNWLRPLVVGGVGAFISFLGSFLLLPLAIPHLGGSFRPTGMSLLILVFFLAFALAYKRYLAKKNSQNLRRGGHYAVLEIRRPPHLILKPSATMVRRHFVGRIAVLLAMAILAATAAIVQDLEVGDRAVFGIYAAVMGGWFLMTLRDQICGVGASDTFRYQPPAHPSSTP